MKILGLVSLGIVAFVLLVLNHEFLLPREQAGTVDGWLGFSGGLFGGYLAFISAYYIYRKQRHDNVRPILVIEKASTLSGNMLHVIHRDLDVDAIPQVGTKQVSIRIRNIGLGAALDIECDDNSKYKLYCSLPDGYGCEVHETFVLTGIAANKDEVRDLLMELPSLEEHASRIVEFTLVYRGAYGQKYTVTAQVLIESTERITSEFWIRTIKRT
ncbi:hypothetical protein BCU85_23215 [Vibrio lentus]|uniref:hypothetical protein n=1 Tax=Vibrio TaxID=662 RepID=UPI000C8188A0|nr:hypothetical protein [Vibrio lentus]MCC4815576.1 hypothetical protein [Vibrio lentus]PMG70894.1 hypothetical protein BCU85_23215 [Vibrio lentus]PMK89166.1 hypothetical protein BCT88_23805 [Vibrio lentus]PML24088.1 hypothetical protein BCT80_22905 [Vibrio lentus]PMM26078.1 hypothetical protein BCT57_05450 [Vibrio lentus]